MTPPDLKDRVADALCTHVAPALELDGGELEVVAVADGIASIRFGGACASCPGGVHVLITAIEQELRKHVPEVEFVEAVP